MIKLDIFCVQFFFKTPKPIYEMIKDKKNVVLFDRVEVNTIPMRTFDTIKSEKNQALYFDNFSLFFQTNSEFLIQKDYTVGTQ